MVTADRDAIVQFCTEYLKASEFDDYCANGLQVEGRAAVNRIVSGVSWSQRLVDRAIAMEAGMVLVHHGLFGNMFGKPPVIAGLVGRRLAQLLKHEISLVGFHLPLDAHPKIGNNVAICNLLKISKLRRCDVGFVGELARTQSFKSFLSKVNSGLSTNSQVLAYGPERVKCVGVISGGSSPDFQKALAMGADTYICGDMREEVVRLVEEAGANLINVGHYNSERLGVQKLGSLIQKRFKIAVEFFEVPCDV